MRIETLKSTIRGLNESLSQETTVKIQATAQYKFDCCELSMQKHHQNPLQHMPFSSPSRTSELTGSEVKSSVGSNRNIVFPSTPL